MVPIKREYLENCAPFTNCISRINNMQVDDSHDIDVVILMYNLIAYIDDYWKISGLLWQCGRDKPAINPADDNPPNPVRYKEKITDKTRNNGTKIVEIMVPLKYLSNF